MDAETQCQQAFRHNISINLKIENIEICSKSSVIVHCSRFLFLFSLKNNFVGYKNLLYLLQYKFSKTLL
jgi:hypothetical protein